MKVFEGRVAVVTGGTSGLGREVAIEFAEKGASVWICGRRSEEGNKTIQRIKEIGGEGFFFKCDISNQEEVNKFFEKVLEHSKRLDFAINNAAIIGTNSLLVNYPINIIESLIQVNLMGTIYSLQAEIRAMSKAGGSIVNVASVAGVTGYPRNAPYSATKHAIVGLTKSSALENASKNIRVNCICPGIIETDMAEQVFSSSKDSAKSREILQNLHPLKRFATPKEVAGSIVWLCSKEATYLTGAIIPVDGGYTAQ